MSRTRVLLARTEFGPWPVLAIYSILALVLTYPLVFHLSSAVPNDIGDPLLNTWILAWDSHALLNDPFNLFNANIFYPLPDTLAYSEHLFSTALLALPVQLLTGEPLVAYNLSLLASFPLAAFGMYLLVLRWTGRPGAAFTGGLVFAFNPYRFAAIAHLQLLTFQWLPFILLCLDALLRPGDRGFVSRRPSSFINTRALALLVFILLQLLASWYLAVYTGLGLAVFGLVLLLARRVSRPGLVRLGLVALVALVVIFPFARPYMELAGQLIAARPLVLAQALAAHPTDYLAAAPFNRVFGPLTAALRDRPGFTEEQTLFPGLVAVGLALSLLLTRRPGRYPLPALFLLLVLALALTFPAPYTALATLFPASTIVRVPARWIIPALFALAGLAAYGYAQISERLATRPARLLFWLCAGLLLVESLSAPLPLASVTNQAGLNPAYRWLAAQSGDIALVELPLHSAPAPEYPEVKRLYASTLGWWSLVNGYSGYTPPRQPALGQALRGFPAPAATVALQALAGPRPLYLLVHPGEAPLDRAAWETAGRWQAERQPALQPIGQFDGDYLYRIRPAGQPLFSGPPLATFGRDHPLQLETAEVDRNQHPHSPLSPALRLYWRAAGPVSVDYTVFVHLRAPDGFVLHQADGPPVSGHYPTSAWAVQEPVQDIHPLTAGELSRVDHLAVGLYNPLTGERLPAFGPGGRRLADDAVLIPLK